jgi:hypothetical protein
MSLFRWITAVWGGKGSSQLELHGTLAQLNVELAALPYVPDKGYVGPDTLYIEVVDPGNPANPLITVTAYQTVPITVGFAPPNAATFNASTNGQPVTLTSPTGTTLANVQAVPNPSPSNIPSGATFPVGFFAFQVQGLAPGAATTVTLGLPSDVTVNTYYRYGPTPDNSQPHWYSFLFDGTTGAEIDNTHHQIILHFVDGQRGDDDLAANGSITDPGGPAFIRPSVRYFAGAALPARPPRSRSTMPKDNTLVADFLAYDPGFTGGVQVAVGDVNGDGIDDIITGAGPGGAPHVKVIDGSKLTQVLPDGQISDGALLASFFAYDPSFRGGVLVAAGEDSSGKPEVITTAGPGPGAEPPVKTIDPTRLTQVLGNGQISDTALLDAFFASTAPALGGIGIGRDVFGAGLLSELQPVLA